MKAFVAGVFAKVVPNKSFSLRRVCARAHLKGNLTQVENIQAVTRFFFPDEECFFCFMQVLFSIKEGF
jgi:hypothetical protein